MQTELIIHMGMHKTGSSSIQKFLAGNRTILEEGGYSYPDYNASFDCEGLEESGKYINGMMYTFCHGELQGDGFEKKKWETFLTKLTGDLSESNIILSDEAIFSDAAGSNYVRYLREHLEGYRIRCCVYLRRQDMHMESYRAQLIKAAADFRDEFGTLKASTLPMEEFYNYCLQEEVPFYNYYTWLKKYEDIVGRENMQVEIYEDACKNGLCRHFAERMIGMDYRGFTEERRSNVTSTPLDTEIKRRLNLAYAEYPDAIKGFINSLYIKTARNGLGEKAFELKAIDRKKILEFYAEENKAVAEHYFNRTALFGDKTEYSYIEFNSVEVCDNYTELLENMLVWMVCQYRYPLAKDILEQGKKIVLFGAGSMCQKVISQNAFPVEFIIDNDKEKDGIQIQGVSVVWSGKIKNWKNYFVLITPLKYQGIEEQLMTVGLKYGEDFVHIEWKTEEVMSWR